MNEDNEKVNNYNKGFKAGQEHKQPSLQTSEFINKFSLKLTSMENEIQNIKDDVREIKLAMQGLPDKKDLKIMAEETANKVLECADKKYADGKEFNFIKNIVYGFILILILGTLGVIGYLIKEHLGIK